MYKLKNYFHAWLQKSVYVRLYVPLTLLIILVSGFRYYLLIQAETTEVRQRASAEMRQASHFLLPVIKELSARHQPAEIKQLIEREISTSDQITEITWQDEHGQLVAENITNSISAAPPWFFHFILLKNESQVHQIMLSDGAMATLQLTTSPATVIDAIWAKVCTQAKLSAAIIFTIFFLLSLILRANARTLAKLAIATIRFKKGEHSVRMEVAGSVESRALASTFNSMTEEVQKLFKSLQLSRHELAIEKEIVETTLASIGDAVISTDIDGNILTLNKVAHQLTGWSQQEAHATPLKHVFTLLDAIDQRRMTIFVQGIHVVENKLESSGNNSPNNSEKNRIESDNQDVLQSSGKMLINRNGQQHEIDFTASPIKRKDSSVIGCVLVFRDVSEKRLLMQRISWQAGHDQLTGLENRHLFTERFKLAIEQANADQYWLAVCLLDLDHFQTINEQHGQEVANKLLQNIAGRLETCIATANSGNYIARLGGDEFVALIQVQIGAADLEDKLTRLMTELSRPHQFEQKEIAITASIGVAIYPRDDLNPDILLRSADQAMYQAKLNGRNQFHVFDAQLDQQVRTHHNQRTRIRRALIDGELRLYYQPKVNMRKGEIIGMEALLRWQHPDKGIVGPLHFLPIVEHTDLIVDIGEWVIHQALEQLVLWYEAYSHWVLSVNIAARHFQHPDFLARLTSILADYPQVNPQSLEIEILESAAIQDIQYVREVIIACQELGVRFALDDFGTGYSSLSYLKRLPTNTLKIDQSFVRNMLEDQEDLALISAVIGLADAFKREVIAEGVETAEQGVSLMRLGCDYAQGYVIAHPMPARTVDSWVRTYRPASEWSLQAKLA
ncbi:diguanylate cyclase (GGDEF)-like protein [Undibacterium sp. GrIS 1.8]|uniref:EAL domain-containing protein n=1 Tax=Undibacterium sp. GrIS 1.8 TaxID=3143934 RepID=UPI0033972950